MAGSSELSVTTSPASSSLRQRMIFESRDQAGGHVAAGADFQRNAALTQQGHDAREFAVDGDEGHGVAFAAQLFGGGIERRRLHSIFHQHGDGPDQHPVRVHFADHTLAGDTLKTGLRPQRQGVGLGGFANGARQRVLAARLQTGGPHHNLLLAEIRVATTVSSEGFPG